MTFKPITREELKPWVLVRHYAKRMPMVQYAFGAYDAGMLVGVVTYGQTNSPTLRKNICGEEYAGRVLELNRLCLDSDEKNLASRLLAASFKLLPSPSILVSFADASFGHVGYIYQATNWIYTGCPRRHNRTMTLDGKDYSPRNLSKDRSEFTGIKQLKEHYGDRLVIGEYPAKHRYVYFLGTKKEKKDMREAMKYKSEPYPKGETRRYDMDRIDTEQQGVLL